MELPRIFVNVNGTVCPPGTGALSPLDHGFLYGDSVYETVRTYYGQIFLLGAHLDRLQRSLDRVFLSLPLTRKHLEREIARTLADARGDGMFESDDNVGMRIVVSRGVGPIGLDVTRCSEPIYLIYVFPIPVEQRSLEPDEPLRDEGLRIVISKTRRNSPRALDPSIKSGNFLNNILAFKDAHDASADEAILCNSEGYLAEGTTCNVFVVNDGLVWTPHPYGILDGITRAVLFEEAKKAGLELGETNIPAEALFSADEVFITSSVRGVAPVSFVNGRVVGDGRVGPVTRQLQKMYLARVEAECGPAAIEGRPASKKRSVTKSPSRASSRLDSSRIDSVGSRPVAASEPDFDERAL